MIRGVGTSNMGGKELIRNSHLSLRPVPTLAAVRRNEASEFFLADLVYFLDVSRESEHPL